MESSGAISATSPKRIEFVIRDRSQDDDNFIYNSYLKSYRRNHPVCRVPHKIYFTGQADILTFLLSHDSVLVACFPEDPTEILGYVIFRHMKDALVLHYVYAKLGGMGIGGELCRAAAEGRRLAVVTHMCDRFLVLRSRTTLQMVFDPYLLPNLMRSA